MVLRIEDTDKARNTEEALRVLLDGMRWLGLDWDEGPEKGGDAGPYFQSQRDEIYAKYLAGTETIPNQGSRALICFCQILLIVSKFDEL